MVMWLSGVWKSVDTTPATGGSELGVPLITTISFESITAVEICPTSIKRK